MTPEQQAQKVQRVRLSDGRVVSLRGTEDDIADAVEAMEEDITGRGADGKATPEGIMRVAAPWGSTTGDPASMAPKDMARRLVKTGPLAAGAMVGGLPGILTAGVTGAAAQSGSDALEGRGQSVPRMIGAGAMNAAIQSAGPLINQLGGPAQSLARLGWKKLTGIPSNAMADEVLSTGHGALTPANAARLANPRSPSGAFVPREVRRSTLDAFTSKVPAPQSTITGKINELPVKGTHAAQGLYSLGGRMEGVGGGPAQVARFLRMLLGGDEPE